MSIEGWYYLHVNGDLIFKRTEPEVEPGGFVKKVWAVDPSDRGSAWLICIEALALGADRLKVFNLKVRWNLTDEDGLEFAKRAKLKLFREGDKWCAAFGDFVNIQESQCGFADNALEAFAALAVPGLQGGGRWIR